MNWCSIVTTRPRWRLIGHISLVIVQEQHDVYHYSVSIKPPCPAADTGYWISPLSGLLSEGPIMTAAAKQVIRKSCGCWDDAVFFQGSLWLYSSPVREEQVCFVYFNEVSFWETAKNKFPPDLVRSQWMCAVFSVFMIMCSAGAESTAHLLRRKQSYSLPITVKTGCALSQTVSPLLL